MSDEARNDGDSAALIVWGSVVLTILRLSMEAANWLVLWQIYGKRTVAQDHLSIVKIKPVLVVSNGDVLRGFGAVHWFYGVALWIPSTLAVLIPLMRYGAPGWWKRALATRRNVRPGMLGIVALLGMFFTIPRLPVVWALAIGVPAALIGVWWLRRRVPESNGNYELSDPESMPSPPAGRI